MLHPLLDKAGDDKHSNNERKAEVRNKDTKEEKDKNPAEFEWPEEEMPLDEEADFWNSFVNHCLMHNTKTLSS